MNLRLTLSWGHGLAGSGIMVVLHPRETPCNPCFRMSRSTVHRGGPTVPPTQLVPNLARFEPPFAFIVDAPDRLEGFGVPLGPIRGFSRVANDGGIRIVGRRSDQQDAADRLDSAASRCSSMKAIICGTGGRTPPGQSKLTPSSGSRWRCAIPCSRALAP